MLRESELAPCLSQEAVVDLGQEEVDRPFGLPEVLDPAIGSGSRQGSRQEALVPSTGMGEHPPVVVEEAIVDQVVPAVASEVVA
jgi:hypothetical protein